ncbi:MAG: hypothetical protein APR62_08090 [Smithella sp. SDB]|nr:MAG: hypothetical protein APR62_08090 [Smithella sp. SDB]
MRDIIPPFKFDLRDIISKARKEINDRISGVTITLPFLEFSVHPEATEKKVAKEIVIRLADRRVLNAFECCDDCIEHALTSLQEIRSLLVNKQVEMANLTNTTLFLLIELMLEAIRQFFTFEEQLRKHKHIALELPGHLRSPDTKELYFASLEMLRGHLHRCLLQVAAIAGIAIPKIVNHMRYDNKWQLEAYESPLLEVEVNKKK